MTTILRVKRRLEESPLEALVVCCKRAKTESLPSLFVFSGTITDTDTDTDKDKQNFEYKKAILKERKKNLIDGTRDISTILSKLKEDKSSLYIKNRLKIVNHGRGLTLNDESQNDESPCEYSLVDVYNMYENDDEKHKYAYDLYYSHQDDMRIDDTVDIEGIYPFEAELVYDTIENDEFSEDDDEDSNVECHRGNEYPDTEDDSLDEEDMIRAVQNINIGNDLSSDENEEMVYGYTSTGIGDVKLNSEDIDRYGLAYAKYKSRILTGEGISSENSPKLITFDDSEAVSKVDDESFFYPKYDDDYGDDDHNDNSDSSQESDIDDLF